MKPFRSMLLGLALAGATAAATAAPAAAYVDPDWCTPSPTYAPASEIPTFESVVGRPLGDGPTGSTGRNPTQKLYDYFDAMVAATAANTKVKVIRKSFGTSVMGQDLRFYVISTADNIANLDAGRADGPFWEGIKDGSVSEAAGLAAASSRPAFGWITATPHGGEAAAGEAISRMLYELAARRDCWNARRLHEMDLFLMPVRNPDGRDAPPGGVRTSAWAFDHNRDFGTQNQRRERAVPAAAQALPGPVLHRRPPAGQRATSSRPTRTRSTTRSRTSRSTSSRTGSAPPCSRSSTTRASAYQNYNSYDLFTPGVRRHGPVAAVGRRRDDVREGIERGLRQAGLRPLPRDRRDGERHRPRQERAAAQLGRRSGKRPSSRGNGCDVAAEQAREPAAHGRSSSRCRPARRSAATSTARTSTPATPPSCSATCSARACTSSASTHAPRWRACTSSGRRTSTIQTLPAGTLYIPMDQPLKHWIQAVLGEDPYIPFSYFYDVVQWSYSLQRGSSGDGFLTSCRPPAWR